MFVKNSTKKKEKKKSKKRKIFLIRKEDFLKEEINK